jgi:molybdopterin converting factor small subunit
LLARRLPVDEVVSVTLEFHGRFRQMAGADRESVPVPPALAEAVSAVGSYVRERYGITPPYIMMVNNRHVVGAMKQEGARPLTESDVFRLLPVISGG